jgi:hypothetical protein
MGFSFAVTRYGFTTENGWQQMLPAVPVFCAMGRILPMSTAVGATAMVAVGASTTVTSLVATTA